RRQARQRGGGRGRGARGRGGGGRGAGDGGARRPRRAAAGRAHGRALRRERLRGATTARPVRTHRGQLTGRGGADRRMLTGHRRPESGVLTRGAGTERTGGALLGGRGDQRVIGRGPVHRALIRLPARDPARGLDPQVMAHSRLDDHHIEILLRRLRGGDEGLLHAVPDLRQVGTGDLDGLLGEMHGGSRVGGDPRLRDHLGSFRVLSTAASGTDGRHGPGPLYGRSRPGSPPGLPTVAACTPHSSATRRSPARTRTPAECSARSPWCSTAPASPRDSGRDAPTPSPGTPTPWPPTCSPARRIRRSRSAPRSPGRSVTCGPSTPGGAIW